MVISLYRLSDTIQCRPITNKLFQISVVGSSYIKSIRSRLFGACSQLCAPMVRGWMALAVRIGVRDPPNWGLGADFCLNFQNMPEFRGHPECRMEARRTKT